MNNIKYNEITFTDEQKIDIITSYLNGESSVKIGKRYGLSHKPILKILHKNGINVDQKKFVRKYTLNENYFDQINTPNKAYILGFLYADGHNEISKFTISMSLQEEDKEILEKIRKELCSNKPLEYIDYSNKHDYGYNYKYQFRLNLFSKHMCKSLENIGMKSNKSLSLVFPVIDSKLYSHFIRGYFDGDGSISQNIHNENNRAVLLTITSTNSFCQKIKQICSEQLNLNSYIYDAACHNGITKVFTISGRNVVKQFLDWLYKDADLYLERKYQRYLNYYNINNPILE